MKPDKDLIARLNHLDNRIIYSDMNLFNPYVKGGYIHILEKYLSGMYDVADSNISLRGIAVYLAESGNLSVAKRSPLKNIISCLKDGTELDVNATFNISFNIFDFDYSWYARESAKDFRRQLPEHSHLIFPSIIVYNRDMLVQKPKYGVPKDINMRSQCINRIIISDS